MSPKTMDIETARAVLAAHQESEREAKRAAMQRYVGRFFKYRNCYSLPGPDDYWWLYGAVESVDEWGNLYGLTFQRDIHGKIEIERAERLTSVAQSGVEIPAAEFWLEAGALKSEVELMLEWGVPQE